MKIQNENELITLVTSITIELEQGRNNNEYEAYIQHVANDKKH